MSNSLTVETARKVLAVVDAGLSCGLGRAIPGQMCVEAAVCYAMGLPHSDDPPGVDPPVRALKTELNDSEWSSPAARAAGLRKLAIAQLGSAGAINSALFSEKLVLAAVNKLLPPILRRIRLKKSAAACEVATDLSTARSAADSAARFAARSANSANGGYVTYMAAYGTASAAGCMASAARSATDPEDISAIDAAYYVACAASAASWSAANSGDKILGSMADLCVSVLRELNAPGITLMDQVC